MRAIARRVWNASKRVVLASSLIGVGTPIVYGLALRWVDRQGSITSDFVFWGFPATLALTYGLSIATVLLLVKLVRLPDTDEPATQLAQAFLNYAKKLSSEKRDDAVLKIRAAAAHILHTQGLNDARRALGSIALDSALRTHDEATRASILIDDLGWTEHLLGEDRRANENIQHGIELAQAAQTQQATDEYSQLQVKGMRHLALIEAPHSLEDALARLDSAASIVHTSIRADRTKRVETAQLLHAKALAVAIHHHVHKDGALRPGQVSQAAVITQAHDWAHQARVAFYEAQSFTRYAKALFLERRLLEALGRSPEATQVGVLLLQALEQTTWDAENQPTNIRGA